MSNGIPLHFQTLDPEVARLAVEGIPNVLEGDNKSAEAIYRQHKYCPNGCGATLEKHFGGAEFAFADKNWLIPRCLMKCHACALVLNPFDGMLIERGDPNKAKYGNVPIINPNGDSR